jgi:phage replication O-like protein O
MAPQCEDGYTRIANELLEALCRIRIPGESMQIFLMILRKTYGFGKKEDRISLFQFHSTGIIKSHIPRAVEKLKLMNLITQKGNEYGLIYGINKDYKSWQPLPKKVTKSQKGKGITQKGNLALPKKGTTKETVTKETIQKKEGMLEICIA